jgi:chaperone protein EcpD
MPAPPASRLRTGSLLSPFIMFKTSICRAAIAAVLLAMVAPETLASVVLTGTRVIYSESEREVSLKLTNEGDAPSLMQAWIDDGDPNAAPENAKSPFALTPPLFRLDAKKARRYASFNSSKRCPAIGNRCSGSTFSKYHPSHPAATISRTCFSLPFGHASSCSSAQRDCLATQTAHPPRSLGASRKDDGHHVLTATNPTPYHITYTKVEATAGGHMYSNDAGAMVNPGGTVEFAIDNVARVR